MSTWRVFGPQGREVAALIQRARELTPAEIDRLEAVTLDHPRNAARNAAWYTVWDAALDADRARHAACGAASNAAWDAARYAARYAAVDASASDHARYFAVGAAAEDAAVALVARDLISEQDFETLYRPWKEVIG